MTFDVLACPPALDVDTPAFVLCTGRSGSTLLRAVVNSHPELACPGETNISAAFAAIDHAVSAVFADDVGDDGAPIDATEVATAISRHLASATVGQYSRARGKRRWCDKSLSTLEHVSLIRRIYPGALFICLYRNALDTIASLIEATRYGYGLYGVESYVRAHPTNIMVALGTYWADRTDKILRCEREHSQRCVRVRYEDMVLRPADTFRTLFPKLSLRWEEATIDPSRVFARENTRASLGDHKIRYLDKIDSASVGRGWRLPVDALPAPLIERINALHMQIGYPDIDSSQSLLGRAFLQEPPAGRFDRTLEIIGQRLRNNLHSLAGAELFETREVRRIRLCIAGSARDWVIDLDTRTVLRSCVDPHAADNATEATTCCFVTDRTTLAGIATGDENPAVALRDGRLRMICSPNVRPREQLRSLDIFVSLIRE